MSPGVSVPQEQRRFTGITPRPRGRTWSTAFRMIAPLPNDTSQLQSGLFGVVNVQPEGAEYYRSQVTREDLDQATYYVEDSQEPGLQQKRRRRDAQRGRKDQTIP